MTHEEFLRLMVSQINAQLAGTTPPPDPDPEPETPLELLDVKKIGDGATRGTPVGVLRITGEQNLPAQFILHGTGGTYKEDPNNPGDGDLLEYYVDGGLAGFPGHKFYSQFRVQEVGGSDRHIRIRP